MSEDLAEIERHYARGGLMDRILAALKEAGKDVDRLNRRPGPDRRVPLPPPPRHHGAGKVAGAGRRPMSTPSARGSALARYIASTYECRARGWT